MDNIRFTVETTNSYDLFIDFDRIFELFRLDNPGVSKKEFCQDNDLDGIIYDWLMDKFENNGVKALHFIKENCKINIDNFSKETIIDLSI